MMNKKNYQDLLDSYTNTIEQYFSDKGINMNKTNIEKHKKSEELRNHVNELYGDVYAGGLGVALDNLKESKMTLEDYKKQLARYEKESEIGYMKSLKSSAAMGASRGTARGAARAHIENKLDWLAKAKSALKDKIAKLEKE